MGSFTSISDVNNPQLPRKQNLKFGQQTVFLMFSDNISVWPQENHIQLMEKNTKNMSIIFYIT